jgi:hypothetical protein
MLKRIDAHLRPIDRKPGNAYRAHWLLIWGAQASAIEFNRRQEHRFWRGGCKKHEK